LDNSSRSPRRKAKLRREIIGGVHITEWNVLVSTFPATQF